MRTYEHLVMPVQLHDDPRVEATFLDEMGEQGWDFLGVINSPNPGESRWVFKRPVIEGRS